jgi:hypothetical protein
MPWAEEAEGNSGGRQVGELEAGGIIALRSALVFEAVLRPAGERPCPHVLGVVYFLA